jgi:hypothetical protein
MPALTRRRALLSVASGIAMLAGCTGETDRATIEQPPGERSIGDYEVRSVRDEDGTVLFYRGEELPTATDDERSRTARNARSSIVSEESLAELTFGDAPEAEKLQSFVEATDFDSSSLYLLSMPVKACYEIRLQSVAVERAELEASDLHPHADFCRTYRPADVECEVDEIHTAGFAIRLPFAAEQSTGSGRGMANGCDRSHRVEYFGPTVTPATGGEEE